MGTFYIFSRKQKTFLLNCSLNLSLQNTFLTNMLFCLYMIQEACKKQDAERSESHSSRPTRQTMKSRDKKSKVPSGHLRLLDPNGSVELVRSRTSNTALVSAMRMSQLSNDGSLAPPGVERYSSVRVSL